MILAKVNLPRTDGAFELWLIDRFGGFTVTEARGAWTDDDGIVHAEPMFVYEVAIDPAAPSAPVAAFRVMAKRVARRMGQQAVYYVIDRTPYIIDLTDDE